MKKECVNILKCFDDSYYAGYTTNLERRLNQHNSSHNPGSYTSTRRPVKLFYQHEIKTIEEAKDVER
jgi:putative endonuclease